MADICQFVCPYRTPISGYCGSTGGYATCPHRRMYEPPTIKSAEPIKPMTNADKYIRNLTEYELAQKMWIYCPGHFDGKNHCSGEPNCFTCWLNWLKQEVESDG